MLKRWKKLKTETLYRNPWWTYKLDHFEIPGGISGQYHYVYTHGSSMVLPLTEAGELLMVKQYRYLVERESLEFPCGSVKEGHSYEKTAHLELSEETGYFANQYEEVGEFTPFNGVSSESCKVFLAQHLCPATAHPDETEEFELIRCTPQAIDAMIQTRTIWDGMSLAAWALVRHLILKKLGD